MFGRLKKTTTLLPEPEFGPHKKGKLKAPEFGSIGVMFNSEQKERIAAVFAEKQLNPCPSCGKTHTWNIGEGLVMFPFVTSNPAGFVQSGTSYPCIPIVCSNCGNTMFHNAFTLGLAEFLGLVVRPVSQVAVPGAK